MAYQFQVLSSGGGSLLQAEVAESIGATGSWRTHLELPTGTGPTVQVNRLDDSADTYAVTVTWGHGQKARSLVQGRAAAVEAADRLTLALADIRAASAVTDPAT